MYAAKPATRFRHRGAVGDGFDGFVQEAGQDQEVCGVLFVVNQVKPLLYQCILLLLLLLLL
jgi:hypothetical protein